MKRSRSSLGVFFFGVSLSLMSATGLSTEGWSAECVFKRLPTAQANKGNPDCAPPSGALNQLRVKLSSAIAAVKRINNKPHSLEKNPSELVDLPQAEKEYIEKANAIKELLRVDISQDTKAGRLKGLLRKIFKSNLNFGQQISKMTSKIASGDDFRQEMYDVIRELYRVLSPPPSHYDFRSTSEGNALANWDEKKDPLRDVLKDPALTKDASAALVAFLTSSMIFAQSKAPEVFSCLSQKEKPLQKTSVRKSFGEEKVGYDKAKNEVEKDLNRHVNDLLVRTRSGLQPMKEIYPIPAEQAGSNTFPYFQAFLNRIEGELPHSYPKGWAKDGVIDFPPAPKTRTSSEKQNAAFYLLYNTMQAVTVPALGDLEGKFQNQGLGTRPVSIAGYGHWRTLDATRAEVETYLIPKIVDVNSERTYVAPMTVQISTHCDTVANCESQNIRFNRLPFSGRPFPTLRKLRSIFGIK